MADTALKFGPEWLRALTEPQGESGGVLYSAPLANIKLAEFRYGKEEILALFDKAVKPPEELVNFGSLFVEKCQFPLNLMQMSEEESRAWQRGANSDASLRPFGAPGKRPPSPGGRGRGRGRGQGPFYDRNRSMDDDLEGLRRGAGEGLRGSARNGLGGYERQSSERGGGWFERDRQLPREEEVNGVVSPRKGYTRAPFDDWRRGGEAVEGGQGGAGGAGGPGGPPGQDDGWRTSGGGRRWGGAGTGLSQGQGWRTERDGGFGRSKYGERWRREEDGRGGVGGRGGFTRQRSRNDDHLPEWATDTAAEGGTFDMEGKFRSEQQKNGLSRGEDWGGSEQQRWEDEEVDPEDTVAVAGREAGGPGAGKHRMTNNGSCEKEEDGGECSTPSSWDTSGPPSDKLEVVEDIKNAVKQDNSNHLETLAGNLVASLVDEDEPLPDLTSKEQPLVKPEQPPVVPSPPQSQPGHSWSYLDPQGQVQGPFQSEEMFEWYSAGYFPPDLMLRRSFDQRFVSLTELMKLYSRVPFTPGPAPPPLTDAQEEERLKQQQLQQQLIQQQLMMQQQMMAQQQQQQQHHHQQQQQHHHQQQQQHHHQQQQQQQQHHHHQQQQQQQMMGMPSPHHNSEMNKLFGGQPGQHQGLGSLGLADMSRGFPDPRLNMLAPSLSEPGPDPLKQLLARSQAGAAMPGLGRPHPTSHPQSDNRDTISSMFGMSRGPPPPPSTVTEPHINIPFSQPQANNHSQPQQSNFDPIQSLLAQLHNTSSQPPSPQQSIWDLPPDQDNNKQQLADKPLTSIWNEPPASSGHHHQPESPLELAANKETHNEPTENFEEQEHSESNSQELEADFSENDPTTFVKPKANEKKDKKSKKAEEKRKAKEKKAAEAAGSGPYIPGMSGTVRPEEQIVAVGNIMDLKEEEKYREQQDASRRQREQMDALVKLQEDQRLKLEREEQIRIQQEKLAKLAPWAKKDTSPVKEPGQGLTLQEIQKLEAEREKRERQQRELHEARLREEQRRMEEDERARRAAKTINWATAATPTGGKVKSLAEIQAEEARVERERMEREMAGRTVRAKDGANNSGSGIWGGSGKSGTTWAGKIAANTPATAPGSRSNGNPWAGTNGSPSSAAVVAPAGFWDPVLPETPQQTKKMSGNNVNNNNNRNNKNQKKRGEDEPRGKQQQKSKNEFEEWCSKALQELQAQVDIPTFLGFLMDIESPYEVHDYIKSYVGEGKPQKKFATDYLERRSRWKNSLKSGVKYEDDLTTPATALSPGDGEFQEAGKKGKNKKLTKQSKSKQDISHLLGFSVTGQGVNRGELDMPQ